MIQRGAYGNEIRTKPPRLSINNYVR